MDYQPRPAGGVALPGRLVNFEGSLATVSLQTILTDFLVDRVYPVSPREGTAWWRAPGPHRGTRRDNATFLGFRPRDDQSRSLGYDVRPGLAFLTRWALIPEPASLPLQR